MALTNFPQGLSSFGFPIIGGGNTPLGNVWFVNSAIGADANGYGTDKTRPFDSLVYALTKASAGDTIFIAPGHAEAIATATSLNVSLNDITIIGLGNGNYRPTFTYTLATSVFTVSGAGVTLSGLIFAPYTVVDSVDLPVVVSGADCLIMDCDAILSDATFQADTGFTVSGARLKMLRVKVRANDAGATTAVASSAAAADLVLEDCDMRGNFSVAIIVSTSTFHFTDLLIRRCIFKQKNGTAKNVFNLTTSSTGLIADCRALGTTWATAADVASNSSNAALHWAQNYGDDFGAAASSVLVPAVGTIS